MPTRTARPALDIPIEPDGLARLRAAVARHAGRLGAEEHRDDIVLLAHELATNVVRHGGGCGRLELWRAGRQIHCRVTDSGPGLHLPGEDKLPPPTAPGGRGLWIARRLATLQIKTGPAGTTVLATLELPRPG